MPFATPAERAAIQQFRPQNGHRLRCVNPQAHVLAFDGYHGQVNPAFDRDTLPDLARQN
jgi:hypothetical protein